MSYCINLGCLSPTNSDTAQFCTNCGKPLLLKDRYRPIHLIGRGGFGRTFAAVDEHLPSKPECVAKQLCFSSHHNVLSDKAVELFRQEAERLDELGLHPQIPQLKAHFEQEQQLYLVQELIEGQTLKQELRQEGAFNETKIWELLKDLLQTLQFIHARQVIHRDIKPDNIMRRQSDGKLVLIDFGVAKLITSTALLHTGTGVGSAEYVAPEQLLGKALPASDLYSLGVTCIHLLTAISPFNLFDIARDRWAWRQRILPQHSISHHLNQILDQLLQRAINQRYKSAAEVLQALSGPKLVATKPANRQGGDLNSAVGVNYTKLRGLLAAGKWQQADQETWVVMCQALSKQTGTHLHRSDIDQFPCEDLLTIDQLWVKYSKGRFGFSIQKQIYDFLEGDYPRFCDRVGWPTYNPNVVESGLQFSAAAPKGHLPSRIWVGGVQWWRHAGLIAAKLASCGLD